MDGRELDPGPGIEHRQRRESRSSLDYIERTGGGRPLGRSGPQQPDLSGNTRVDVGAERRHVGGSWYSLQM